jgi:uncharacterized membrane protein YedE/YeeE
MADAIAVPRGTLATARSGHESNLAPTAAAVLIIGATVLYLTLSVSGRQSLLFLVGVTAGLVFYHAAFGFTSSWRHFVLSGRGDGLRAQMAMLALTSLVFFPLLARGEIFGQTLRGSISPVGLSVVVGAFLFGLGMQLGGGCASGTLYTAGGGNTRMLITLVAFIAGSVAGTAHMPWWTANAAGKPISLIATFGVWVALPGSIAAFGAIAALTVLVESRAQRLRSARVGAVPGRRAASYQAGSRWLRGPWPLVAGAVGLALVNIATLLLSGRPWGVTSAFALWGAKALMAAGVNVAAWPYWSVPAQAAALRAPMAADVTSVMNFGIVLGALTAAGLAGRFAPAWRVPPRSVAAALVGGLLLGYGARIAFGCNIGAYFGGIASGSVHGWVWLGAALTGTIAGTRLRPFFGLSS